MGDETNHEATSSGRTFFRLFKRLLHILVFLWVLAFVAGRSGMFDFDEEILPMTLEAGTCDAEGVSELVDNGTDLNEFIGDNDNAVTPLAEAVGGFGLQYSPDNHDEECRETVSLLLSYGVDPSIMDVDGVGAPYYVLVGVNPPQILDLLGDPAPNWCVLPDRASGSLVDLAEENERWTQDHIDTYLSSCGAGEG